MELRFKGETRLIGFLGHAESGQPYLAVPNFETYRWDVYRCDGTRAFDKVGDYNPLIEADDSLEYFTDYHRIHWFDEGNGIAWFSEDLVNKVQRCYPA